MHAKLWRDHKCRSKNCKWGESITNRAFLTNRAKYGNDTHKIDEDKLKYNEKIKACWPLMAGGIKYICKNNN